MPPRITHATPSDAPDSGDGKISSNAWNEDHTIEGLGTAAAADVEDFAAAGDLAGKLNASAVSAFGLTLVDDADAATARGTLGLGTAALQSSSYFALATALAAGLATKQDRKQLTEPTTFFVSASLGDDASDGSPVATVDDDSGATGTPWATIQHAADVISAYDLNGYDVTIKMLDGPLAGAAFNAPHSSRPCVDGFVQNYWINSGLCTVFIEGPDDPSAVSLTCMQEPTRAGVELALLGSPTTAFCLKNFTCDYTNANANNSVISGFNAVIFVGDGTGSTLRFVGPATSIHQGDCINLFNNCYLALSDTIYFEGYFDFGVAASPECMIYPSGCNFSFGPGATLASFMWCADGAKVNFDSGCSFTGTFAGSRFQVEGLGSFIDLSRISGSDLNTIPGSVVGTVSNGGSYFSANAVLRDIPASAVSGLATVATTGSAADLSGTLAAARLPAFAGGDVTSSAGSSVLTIGNGAISLAKQANVATGTIFYRKTAGTGAPEVQTLATLKTDLGLTGTNSGDQDLSGYATTSALTTGLAGKQAAGSYLTANQTITLSGDASGSGATAITVTIGANKVTRAMLAATVGATLLGATAAGNVSDLTAAQAKTFLAITAADVAPAGSTTQVQFNDGGVLAGNAGLTFDKTNKALSVGGATVTTSNPALNVTQTWNASGVTFTGKLSNITDTASAAASSLEKWQKGGVDQFGIQKDGWLQFYTAGSIGMTMGIASTNPDVFGIRSGTYRWMAGQSGFWTGSGGSVGWSSATSDINGTGGANIDTKLTRVGAGIVKVGNASAAAGVLVTATTTVASLPAAATAGAGGRAFVTDATATTFLSTVAGGGSNGVPVVSNGTNWLIG